MKLLEFFVLFVLSAYLGSAFNLRGEGNNTIQQQLSIPARKERNAGFHSRIYSGLLAAPSHLPYVVGLRIFFPNDDPSICGGSIIHPIWVLTAAHCTHASTSVSVHIGCLNFDPCPTVYHITRSSGKIKENREYNQITWVHDIAVIEIPQVSINPARLPSRSEGHPDYDRKRVALAGWGLTSDAAHTHSNTLQYATFRTITNENCAKVYGDIKIYAGKICTKTKNGPSACQGDSGGPLVLVENNVQIGIFSFFGSKGCEKGQPNAFTRVDSYFDWIHSNTGLNF